MRNRDHILVSILVSLSSLFPTQSSAQNKADFAKSCLAAIESGDIEAANQIALTIQQWENLFSPFIISDAEECLKTTTGEEWKYFKTTGGFLEGDEARAEQEYIDGAADRTEAEKTRTRETKCEFLIADDELNKLLKEWESVRAQRTLEVQVRTLEMCSGLYDSDPQSALLNQVCNATFEDFGLPDTALKVDLAATLSAERRLASANVALAELIEIDSSDNEGPLEAELAECRKSE